MVTSNGELLIVYNIVRNCSLWSNVDFQKEEIFREFDFETSELEFEIPKSSVYKHTTSCDKGVFVSIIISQLQRPIEFTNFHSFFLFCAYVKIHQVRRLVFDNNQYVQCVFNPEQKYQGFTSSLWESAIKEVQSQE